MEWMGRRLRWIDGTEEIKKWAAAMSALNVVLKDLDIKGYSDNWRPWKRPIKVGKTDSRKMGSQSWKGTVASKKGTTETLERRIHPNLSEVRPPSVQVEWDDEDMRDSKAAVMEMLKTPQTETLSDSLDLEADEIIRGGIVDMNRGKGADVVSKDLDETTGEKVITCTEWRETEAAEDEMRLNMEKELLWEGIRQKIKAGKGVMDSNRRWKYAEETDFNRLITDTAKQLQIVTGDKIALQWKTRRHIAEKMRSWDFRLRFSI